MLKNIPGILSPELLKILMEMGHGDEIVIGDGNFPAASIAQRLLRLDGHGIPVVLKAILKFFPLDAYVEKPVGLMAVTPGENYNPVIWNEYREIILISKEPFKEFEFIEKYAFYEKARKAYAVVATSESALYANIILKKGVVV
ncbi:MAG: RbsD/FucU domain-containing protein [Ignavibacteriaceae bacterium]